MFIITKLMNTCSHHILADEKGPGNLHDSTCDFQFPHTKYMQIHDNKINVVVTYLSL